jgi:hypothetical protein
LELTTEEENIVRYFWIQLHWTPGEAEEYDTIQKRRKILFENWTAGRMTAEEQAEYAKLNTQLCDNIGVKRGIANEAMYDRVRPELAPRVLRVWKLHEKTREGLTDAEAEELKGLLEWFGKLQVEALEASCQALLHERPEAN